MSNRPLFVNKMCIMLSDILIIGNTKENIMDKTQSIVEALLQEKNIKFKNGLYQYTQVLFAYNSNKIEGSGFTEEQIAEIYERNTIITFGAQVIRMDDLFEVKNHFRLFDYMLDHYDDAITEEMLQEMHGILKRNTTQQDMPVYNVGGFKIKPNGIGFSDCLDTVVAEKVEPYLECLLEEYNKKKNKTLEGLLDFHYAFEKVHPFSDGNGRIGRMILFKECLKHQILPFVILNQHKDSYIKSLKEYKTNKEDLMDICLHEQKFYRDVCERLGIIQ